MAIIERCAETNGVVIRPVNIAIITMLLAVFGALMSVSAAWGKMNAVLEKMETKVDKDVFEVYVQDTKVQFNRIDSRQQRLEDKVDKILEVLSNHNSTERK